MGVVAAQYLTIQKNLFVQEMKIKSMLFLTAKEKAAYRKKQLH